MAGTGDGTQQTASEGAIRNQADYKPSGYATQSWEIVGEHKETLDFQPLEFGVETSAGLTTNPMFRDYGGLPTGGGTRRWHLPPHLCEKFGQNIEEQHKEKKVVKHALTDEEISRMQAEAEESGRQEAMAKAAELHKQTVAAEQQRMRNLIDDLQTQLAEKIHAIELQAVELALAVSQKIINTAVEINPDYIGEVVREALQHAGSVAVKRVRVSPQDLEYIQFADVKTRLDEADSSWQFEADPTIRSGCVIETSAGEVDSQLDIAWERLRDQIVKVLR